MKSQCFPWDRQYVTSGQSRSGQKGSENGFVESLLTGTLLPKKDSKCFMNPVAKGTRSPGTPKCQSLPARFSMFVSYPNPYVGWKSPLWWYVEKRP